MKKLSSDDLKTLIATSVKRDSSLVSGCFIGEFDSLDDPEIRKLVDLEEITRCMDAGMYPKNWKRMSKNKVDEYYDASGACVRVPAIERVFDLVQANDQVRAYVYTDASDTSVLHFYIVGE